MITVITGTPGAGKTLYTIEKLLLPLVGSTISQQSEDGVVTTHPRTIYTNINGLLLDHELIDGGDKQGLRDWHKWAKPGSVIVFDEVQRHWKPRANGSAVPADIEALETHRHMGVDFIIITQNVMLVDKNIHALGGRHLHVRRIANMPMAIVYEWDHVSRGLLYAKEPHQVALALQQRSSSSTRARNFTPSSHGESLAWCGSSWRGSSVSASWRLPLMRASLSA